MKVDYHMIAEKMHRTMEGNVVKFHPKILKKEIKYSYTLQNRADDKNLIIALFCKWKSGEK